MSNPLAAVGGAIQAYATLKAGKAQSKALKRQARATFQQSAQDEYQQRREARELMGRQAAGFAEAGIGYGGTTELVMRDSAIKAELDALNIRYRGVLQGRGLQAEARNVKRQSRLLAGAQLLSGLSNSMGS